MTKMARLVVIICFILVFCITVYIYLNFESVNFISNPKEISNVKTNRVIPQNTDSSNTKVKILPHDWFTSEYPSEWSDDDKQKKFHTPTYQSFQEATQYIYNEVDTSSDDVVDYPPMPSQQWVSRNLQRVLEFLKPPNRVQKTNWIYANHITLLKTYYSPKTDVIYTGIPKAGCTNWKFTLLTLEGNYHKRKPSPMVHYAINHLNLANKVYSYSTSYLDKKYTFTVIRNPWTRMVSGYNDKFGQGRNLKKWQKGRVALQILRNYRNQYTDLDDVLKHNKAPSFLEFLQHLANDPIREINAHFRPQYSMLSLSAVVYDFVGSLEFAKEQSRTIFDHFKTSKIANVTVPGPYDSSTDPRKERSSLLAIEWFKNIPRTLVEKLYAKFKPDFMIYNYSNFSDPLFPFPLYNPDTDLLGYKSK